MKRPIFQGNTEQAQLEIISQYCGSPSPENWPGVINLPNHKVMRLKNYYPRRLRDKFGLLVYYSTKKFRLLYNFLNNKTFRIFKRKIF